MWPKSNTAFVVIHGHGSHKPFQALDSFVRGFWDVLEKTNEGSKIRWIHKLQQREGWVESDISLVPDSQPTLDFYEFYWDRYMVHDIAWKDVFDWFYEASEGARRFYKQMPQLAKDYEKMGVELFKDGEFTAGGYLNIHWAFNWALRLSLRFRWVSRSWVLRILPLIMPRRLTDWLLNQIHDAVVYLNPNVRWRHFDIRGKVLSGVIRNWGRY